MKHAKLARPVAVGVVRRGEELLVSEGYDSVKGEQFWRLLGGTIEFGELGADTVVREFMEELGVEMRVRSYLGTLENIFTWGVDRVTSSSASTSSNLSTRIF